MTVQFLHRFRQIRLFQQFALRSILNLSSVKKMTTVVESQVELPTNVAVDNCLFCTIIREKTPGKLIHDDDEVVAFADIKPAAQFHYLIVPKTHIKDCKQLKTSEDKALVEKMYNIAKKILSDNNADVTNARYGFHWPPFHTVAHLHLHAISPPSEMGFVGKWMFRPDSWWFVSPEYVISRL